MHGGRYLFYELRRNTGRDATWIDVWIALDDVSAGKRRREPLNKRYDFANRETAGLGV
jgi:hypothetical protein